MHSDHTTLLERLLTETFDTSGTHVDLSTPLTLSNQTNFFYKCQVSPRACFRFRKRNHPLLKVATSRDSAQTNFRTKTPLMPSNRTNLSYRPVFISCWQCATIRFLKRRHLGEMCVAYFSEKHTKKSAGQHHTKHFCST